MRALLRSLARSPSSLGVVLLVVLGGALGCERPERAICRDGYGPCAADYECFEGSTCGPLSWPYGSGQACLTSCRSELDCPRVGGIEPVCLDAHADGNFLCYRECHVIDECPPGWVCQPVRFFDDATASVCMP